MKGIDSQIRFYFQLLSLLASVPSIEILYSIVIWSGLVWTVLIWCDLVRFGRVWWFGSVRQPDRTELIRKGFGSVVRYVGITSTVSCVGHTVLRRCSYCRTVSCQKIGMLTTNIPRTLESRELNKTIKHTCIVGQPKNFRSVQLLAQAVI